MCEFQNGRTDAQGRFAFLPDKPGTWTIVVADNMGHKVSHPMTITLSDEGTVEREVAPSGFSESLRALPVLFRAVLGVSLLLNLFPRAGPVPASCGEAGLGMRFCIRRSGTVISRQGIGLI